MELSKRLKAVADLVPPGSVVCDVGCDHGYVSIYLIQNRICTNVIAMDIHAGPLEQARGHIGKYHLEAYIETRQSDGLAALRAGEADCVILAGMGGRLTVRILQSGRDVLDTVDTLVLQSQSEIAAVRAYLRDAGYGIVREDMVWEGGKYYPMLQARRGQADAVVACGGSMRRQGDDADVRALRQPACDRYGPYLLAHRHPVLQRFLLWEREREERILAQIGSGPAAENPENRKRQEELRSGARIRTYALSCFEERPDPGRRTQT